MKKIIILLTVSAMLLGACTAKQAGEEPSVTAAPTAEPVVEASLEPVLEEYEYVYTPYVIPEICTLYFGEEEIQLACEIVDAFIAHESSVSASDEATAQDALALATRLFPPFYAFAQFNEYTAYKDGTVSWKLTQSEDEHKTMLAEFQTAIEDYMKVLKKGDSETARAMALYKELLTGSWYDHSFEGIALDYSPIELTGYYFLLERSGICVGYADAYAYLLMQAGINATDVGGADRAFVEGKPSTPHQWVIMELEGNYYFADPTWEANGNELGWFGITREYREGDWGGQFVSDNMCICGIKQIDKAELDMSDTRFAEFHTDYGVSLVREWEFNDDRTAIIYKDASGATRTFRVK